jgi:vacuolar-type H+-ATPase subunit H
MAQMEGGLVPPGTYNEYVESEQSLLEQIRVKEEELGLKISAAEQEYATVTEGARKEAEEIVGRYRETAESEAADLWKQAMEKAGIEAEKIRCEGEKKIMRDRERQQKHFSAVVDHVVNTVLNGTTR